MQTVTRGFLGVNRPWIGGIGRASLSKWTQGLSAKATVPPKTIRQATAVTTRVKDFELTADANQAIGPTPV